MAGLRAAIREHAVQLANPATSAPATQLTDDYLFSLRPDTIVHMVARAAIGRGSLCGSTPGDLVEGRPIGPFCEACAKAFTARVFPLAGRGGA